MYGNNDNDVNFYDLTKDDIDIGLEPRLLEYLKKKQYFKEHGIEINNLERDFEISKADMTKIKMYLKGVNPNSKHVDYVDPSASSFPSSKMAKDPRFDRIKNKQKHDEEAKSQKDNYSLMNRGYDMYRKDRPFASAYGDDFDNKTFHPRSWFENSRDTLEEINPYVADFNDKFSDKLGSSFNDKSINSFSDNQYVHPKSKYNGYIEPSTMKHDPHSVDSIFGKLNSYRQRVDTVPFRSNEMDIDNKVMIPRNVCNEKREVENNYRTSPFIGTAGGTDRNIDVDSYVRLSAGTRGYKSGGYPNPAEHYFDYISDDIQQADHVVNSRGMPSRMANREVARPFQNIRR